MTATAAAIPTLQKGQGHVECLSIPVAASTTIYGGSLVAVNASGYLVSADDDTALIIAGRARSTVNNSAGSAGALSCEIERGAFRWQNSATTDAITIADVGHPCFAVDNQTVARTDGAGTRPMAGLVISVETGGVFVETFGGADPRVCDMMFPAGADLSSSQYLFVELASGGTVTVCNAAGEAAIGVLQNAPASGAIAIVRTLGPSLVIASTSINRGVVLATTAAGKSKAAQAGRVTVDGNSQSNVALLGSHAMGHALTAGTADTAHAMLLTQMGLTPTTAE